MKRYPDPLNSLMTFLKKFPGVGQKSAERFAFHLLTWKDLDLQKFAKDLSQLKMMIKPCTECGAFLDNGKCGFCETNDRDTKSLCILSSVKDIFAIEETHIFSGLYHVLPKLLSPLDGNYEDQVDMGHLRDRIEKRAIKEVIIALDSTLEGDATSLYIKGALEDLNVVVTRLAFGLPLGSSLDFVDEGTLNRAIMGRQPMAEK